MTTIFKNIVAIVAMTLGLHLCAVLVAGIRWPADRSDYVFDSGNAKDAVEVPEYLIYFHQAIESSGRKLFLIGASNVREGFRPNELSPDFPATRIFNLGLGASNITQLASIVDLVLERLPAEVAPEATFVLGVWYGSFTEDRTRWKGSETYVDEERLRYGLYRKKGGQIVPVLPARSMTAVGALFRPIGDAVNLWRKLQATVGASASARSDGERPAPEVFRQMALAGWDGYMGGNKQLSDEQFEKLANILRKIDATGAHAIVISMPLPRWHKQSSPYFAVYPQHIEKIQQELKGLRNVRFDSLSEELDAEGDFYDSAHPQKFATPRWARSLTEAIRGTH